jgi:hypothetical protein
MDMFSEREGWNSRPDCPSRPLADWRARAFSIVQDNSG